MNLFILWQAEVCLLMLMALGSTAVAPPTFMRVVKPSAYTLTFIKKTHLSPLLPPSPTPAHHIQLCESLVMRMRESVHTVQTSFIRHAVSSPHYFGYKYI